MCSWFSSQGCSGSGERAGDSPGLPGDEACAHWAALCTPQLAAAFEGRQHHHVLWRCLWFLPLTLWYFTMLVALKGGQCVSQVLWCSPRVFYQEEALLVLLFRWVLGAWTLYETENQEEKRHRTAVLKLTAFVKRWLLLSLSSYLLYSLCDQSWVPFPPPASVSPCVIVAPHTRAPQDHAPGSRLTAQSKLWSAAPLLPPPSPPSSSFPSSFSFFFLFFSFSFLLLLFLLLLLIYSQMCMLGDIKIMSNLSELCLKVAPHFTKDELLETQND